MKIPPHFLLKSSVKRPRLERREDGMACLVMISLLAIMMILSMEELRCLAHLRREIKFMEHQQSKRLDRPPDREKSFNQAPATPAP